MSTIVSGSKERNGSKAAARNGAAKSPAAQSAQAATPATATPTADSAGVNSVGDQPDDGAGLKDELLREIHWTRGGGGFCFADTSETRRDAVRCWDALRAAVEQFDDPTVTAVLRAAVGRQGKPAALVRGVPKPAPSFHSETLRTSVLRTDWSPEGVQLAIDWSSLDLRIELSIGRDLVFAGLMPPQVKVNGRSPSPIGTWEEVCWDADTDADYLELELELSDGVRLQRQFLLARRDGVLWIADSLLNPVAADLECTISAACVPTTRFAAADETREVVGTLGRRSCVVLPAALPEWRVESHAGELVASPDAVRLRQSARGAVALYVPLCIVVDPQRARRPSTWRRLTIGEDLKIQPADRAVGYRIQVGNEQWLVYRSLTPRANRSVLGVNLQTSFLFTRIRRPAEVETITEIEN